MPMPMCAISLVGEHAHILFRHICLGVLWADWVSKPISGKTTYVLAIYHSCMHTYTSHWLVWAGSWLKVIHHEWASGLFECLDNSPELVPGSISNIGGAAFTHVETVCRGIPCPLYDRNKEITCVVCTK